MPGRIVIFPAACGASFPTISQLLALAVPVEIRPELPNGIVLDLLDQTLATRSSGSSTR
jgi:hypothetical protein